ncbi:hypothetical protein [Promicromonospora soli]
MIWITMAARRRDARGGVPTRLPAFLAQDLGDIAGELAAGHVPREEPQNDVLPLADQSVLPRCVMPYLALGPVKLL